MTPTPNPSPIPQAGGYTRTPDPPDTSLSGAGGAPGVMDVSIRPITKQDILKPGSKLSVALTDLIQTHVRAENDAEQTTVYAKIRRNNLYYRGKQFLMLLKGPDGTIDYKPIQSNGPMDVTSGWDGNRGDFMYDNVLPLFRGDVRKWCGVLGVRSPNAKCMPRTTGDDHQIRLSRIGDRAISYLRNSWKADELQRYLSYSLAVNGTTFGYVQYVADELKYGATELPKLETVQIPVTDPYFACWKCGTSNPVMSVQQSGRCQQCAAPLGPEDYQEPDTVPGVIQTGTTRYSNGAVELQLATPATVKTPYYIVDLDHCPWLWYEYLVNRYELIRTYAPSPKQGDNSPDAQLRRELREFLLQDRTSADGMGISTGEIRRTLNTLSSPSGNPYERRDLAAFGQYWLSPGELEALPGDQEGNLRDQIIANFPKGVHLVYVNGKLADIRSAGLAEHWTVCQPDTGDYIYRDAVFDDYIQGQDVINDALNLLIQQAEKSSPLTFFDPDIVDPDYLRNRAVQTGEFLEAKKGVGGQLAQSFFRLPVASPDDTLIKFIEFYILKNRENVGIMPAIYGGGEADEAVGVAKIRRNQSLMQLNIPWNYMRDFWSGTYENAIRLLARYSNGKLVTSKGASLEIEELDGIWDLAQGGIVVQTEEAMPLTWAQRQEQVESALQRPVQAWSLLGLTNLDGSVNPANLELLQESTGLEDWEVPGLAAKERLLDIIQQLLQAGPIDQPPPPPPPPGLPDPQTGMVPPPPPPQPPPQPQPSIQPNQTMFDAPFAVQVCRSWVVSDKGSDAEKGTVPGQSPRGFENVLAYTQAWMDLAAPPPPQPDPPKVSVTVKPTDMLVPGVSQIMQEDFGIGTGQPPPPGTEQPPPPPPGMGAGPGGPPMGAGGPPPPPPNPGPPASAPPPVDQRGLAGPPPVGSSGPPPMVH